jgi:hypothetical protein
LLLYDICDLLEHLVHLVLVDVLVLIHRINHHVAEVLIWARYVSAIFASFSKSRRQLTVVLAGLALDQVP